MKEACKECGASPCVRFGSEHDCGCLYAFETYGLCWNCMDDLYSNVEG